ncbi:hypothetical protein OV079_52065 [Nannocystis pusilla]|uniref:Uncharacterized protein n=1 Tax=Nannocystis pusilla TaxID=889268 RepID=A0A9X3F0X8_9BACT|nr:hypothetical protein [Nannocystis pusilla]MCY1013928.1 hypothetical protein [Nannocystis pusilla]
MPLKASPPDRPRGGAVARIVVHLELTVDLEGPPAGEDLDGQLIELGDEVVALGREDLQTAGAGGPVLLAGVFALDLPGHVEPLELDDRDLVDEAAEVSAMAHPAPRTVG